MDLHFHHFTSENGLAQNSVNVIMQDKNGFIWLGTQEGLNRFDGNNFETFKYNNGIMEKPSSNYIICLHEDKNGMIWIGTKNGGVNRFDPVTENFSQFLIDKAKTDNPCNTINCFYEDTLGKLWIGTDDGLKIFDRKTGSFDDFPLFHNSLEKSDLISIYDILEDGKGNIWLATNSGIFQISKNTFKVKRIPLILKNKSKHVHRTIFSICEDRTGTLWFGSDYGLYKLDNIKDGFIHKLIKVDFKFAQSSNIINTVFEDSYGTLWLGTEYGLHILDRKSGKFQSFFYNSNIYHGLNGNAIKDVFEDRAGSLWVGMDSDGLDRLTLTTRLFKYYYSNPKNPDKISSHNVFSLYEDKFGWLWIGTFGDGLNVYNRHTEQLINYRNIPDDKTSISCNKIWAICEDKKDQIWVGTAKGGLNRFSRKEKKFTRYMTNPENPNSLSNNSISSIIEDKRGNIWIATNGGIDKYLPESDGFAHYKHKTGIKNSLIHDVVYSLYEDDKGIIWAGTANGVSVLDSKNGRFVNSDILPLENENIINKPVFSICQDKPGIMWIGSIEGLIEYHPKDKKIKFYRKEDGLPNNVINGILKGDRGNLWISTNMGLSRYNLKTGKFRNYSRHDGLQSFEFNGGAYFKSERGEMFFGGIKGFNSFFPEDIKNNPYIPPVFITGLKVSGEAIKIGKKIKDEVILKKSVISTDEINLNYKQYRFSIEFVALNYIDSKNNKFAYKMEGVDEHWNYIGNRRYVTFANLNPGEYVFKVKASNNNGVWNEKGASLKIRIIPAFWQTLWLKLLLFIFLLLMIQLIILRRNNLKKRRKQELESIVVKKTAEIREKQEKYQTVVETSTQGIIILQREMIIFLNSQFCSLIGRNENQILNTRLSKFIKASEVKKFKSFIKAMNKNEHFSGIFETVLLSENGEEINVEIDYKTIEYKNSSAILMFFQNISLKKLLEEERIKIARLESAKNIAKGISHDYNNLLTVILGYLGFALDKVKQDSVVHSYLLKIKKAGYTAANLTQQFLSIAGGGDSQKKVQSVISVLSDVTDELMQDSKINYNLDISKDLWNIDCSLNDLSCVFKNIITNAVQSMNDKGRLIIKAENKKFDISPFKDRNQEDYILISFIDDGHGISEEDLPNIFDPYFSTRKHVSQKGLGLGLAVVNMIINQHKGIINVESEINKGTKVSLFFPAVTEKQ